MVSNGSDHWQAINLAASGKLVGNSLKEQYDVWCRNYNQDNARAGYNGPLLAALKVSTIVSRTDSRVLDVACGTGLVAKELSRLGFTNVDGVDISEKSIDMARTTGLYRNLYIQDINKDGLPGEPDLYDVLICVGTFTPGHLNQAIFPEFCRVVKPGGFIVIAMREEYLYTAAEFKGSQLDVAVVELAEKKIWNYVSRERVQDYIGVMPGAVFVFQMC